MTQSFSDKWESRVNQTLKNKFFEKNSLINEKQRKNQTMVAIAINNCLNNWTIKKTFWHFFYVCVVLIDVYYMEKCQKNCESLTSIFIWGCALCKQKQLIHAFFRRIILLLKSQHNSDFVYVNLKTWWVIATATM